MLRIFANCLSLEKYFKMAGYNFHYYLDNNQSKIKKELQTATTVILWVRKSQFKIKYRTAIKVKPSQWDSEKQEVKRNKVGYSTDNNYLLNIKTYAQDIFLENSKAGISLTHSVLKRSLDVKLGLIDQSDQNDLFKFIESYIEDSKATKEQKTTKGYTTTLNRLTEFNRKYNFGSKFDSVNLEFYTKFVVFLLKEKNYSINGAGTHIKNLKLFLRESYDYKLHTNTVFSNRKFKPLKQETYPIYLTMKEVGDMYRLDLSSSPRLEKVRDIFIVGCMTGLRFSDFSRLRAENIKPPYIEIIPQKTKDSSPLPIVIPILAFATDIFDKYRDDQGRVLPRVPTNQKMNEFLKEIGYLAKINELVKNPKYSELSPPEVKPLIPKYSLISTHTGRRSYCTNAYEQGIKPFYIMKVSGHKTETAFMRYIRQTSAHAADKVAEGWNII